MPVNSHLEWHDITTFGGLYTIDRGFNMPANAAQQMDNCYPLPQGGLRAFYSSQGGGSLTGIDQAAETIKGLFVTGAGNGEYFIITQNGSNHKFWRSDSLAGTFSLLNTEAGTSRELATFSDYVTTAGARRVVFNLTNFYSYTLGSGSAASLADSVEGDLHVRHQGRIVMRGTSAGGQIVWTDPGGVTFPSTNFLNFTSWGNVMWLRSFRPSDLLVGLTSGEVFNVQGDLSNPAVRELPSADTQRSNTFQIPAQMRDGSVIWWAQGQGYLRGSQGGHDLFSPTLNPLEILGSPVPTDKEWSEGTGAATRVGQFLFMPHGNVFDTDTGAWFRVTDMADSRLVVPDYELAADGTQRVLHTKWDETDWEIKWLDVGRGLKSGLGTSDRATTYTWKSAPLRAATPYTTEIREVNLAVESFDASSEIDVIVGGTTRSVTNLAVGRHLIPFYFQESGEFLDVTVTASATNAEAPMLEAVRIGWHPLHQAR